MTSNEAQKSCGATVRMQSMTKTIMFQIARIAHSINHIFNSHERCPQNCIIYGAKASTFLSKTAASGRAWVFFYGIHPSGKTEAFCMEIDTFQKLKKKNIFSEKFSDSSLFIILLRK